MDRLVSTEWLAKELGSPDLRVLDCTVALEFKEVGGFEIQGGRSGWERGHIPGSQHADLLADLSDPGSPVPLMLPGAEDFARAMGALGVGDDTRVVLYDAQANMWAARVWWMLRAYGFDNAAVLDGGLTTWLQEGRELATDAGTPPRPATFTPRPRPEIFVDKDFVRSAIDSADVTLVDALQPETYRGDRVDYGRPGHIPSAVNVPFFAVLDMSTQQYLPPAELKQALAPALEGDPRQVVTYCGGAVAASSVAFALGLIGIDGVAIYDGSMLEWAADPSLPLETAP